MGVDTAVSVGAATKTSFVSHDNLLTPEDVVKEIVFKVDTEDIVRRLANGEGVVVRDPSSPYSLAVVKPRQAIPTGIEFKNGNRTLVYSPNGEIPKNAIEYVELTENQKYLQTIAEALSYPRSLVEKFLSKSGILLKGFEEEYLIVDHELQALANYPDRELLEGIVERDTLADSLCLGVLQLAQLRKQVISQTKETNEILLSMGYMPLGNPSLLRENTNHEDYGNYIAAMIELISTFRGLGFKPRDEVAEKIMNDVATNYGYTDWDSFYISMDSTLPWASCAGHLNLGLPYDNNNAVDAYVLTTVADGIATCFGRLTEILSATGPYVHGIAANFEGNFLRDVRQSLRNNLGTANYPDSPIGNPETLIKNIIKNIEEGYADRVDRSGYMSTDKDGNVSPVAHGTGRIRVRAERSIDEQGNIILERTVRVEDTGISASDIRSRGRQAALAQFITGIGILAAAERKSFVEYVSEKTGLSEYEIWGDARGNTQDYNMNGANSESIRNLLNLSRIIVDAFSNDLKAFSSESKVVNASLDALSKSAKTLEEYAKTGNGTLGETLVYYAEQGYDAKEVALLVHKYQAQEANFIAAIDHNSEVLQKYLEGNIGFVFDPNMDIDYIPCIFYPEI